MKLSGVHLSVCPFTASFAYCTPSWQVRCCGPVGQQMQARRQEMKWGVFFVKNGKWGCFFCKKKWKMGVHHRFQCFFHLRAHSLRKGDEHPAYIPHGVWHSLLILADAGYKACRCPEGGTRFFRKKVDLSSTQGALCTVSVFFILHLW